MGVRFSHPLPYIVLLRQGYFFIDAISLMVYDGVNEHNWCGKYKVWCGNWCGCGKCVSLKADEQRV